MNINWNEIKDGFRGFEKLALDYVKDNFNNPTWKKTKETRDGNKDAVAYIFGYQSTNNKGTQWWMEAKYSTERYYTNRYRLDATIVSALLEDNIEKVIFVTNTIIRSKTILDIRTALLKSTNCQSVEFCTKFALEYWLSENTKWYKKHFKINNNEIIDASGYQNCFLTQEIELFDDSADKIAFVEPARELYVGEKYSCHFSFYSPEDMDLEIRKNNNCVGIKILKGQVLSLKKGDNNLEFQILIKENAVKNKGLYFKLGNVDIITSYPIVVLNRSERIIDLPSQTNLVKKIEKKLNVFLKDNTTKYVAICGFSGSGRTQILKKLGESRTIKSEYFHQISFTESRIWNSNLLVEFILFLLFPYLNPNDIDQEYINKLPASVISNDIVELINVKNDYDKLIELFQEKLDWHDFLPISISINRRIIFIDNLSHLDENNLSFFFKLLKEIRLKNLPIFIVSTAEYSFINNKVYKNFSAFCSFETYNYVLDYNDINHLFNSNLNFNSIQYNFFEQQLNITELFVFYRYVYCNEDSFEPIDGIDSFIAKYKIFQSSNILQNHIKNEFRELFNSNPNCRKSLDRIYSSHIPLSIESVAINSNDILPLIKSGLVKYDYYNRLMPVNQIYQKYYINNYDIDCNNLLGHDNIENSEFIKIKFENDINPSELQQISKIIFKKCKERKYSFILYVLDNVFENLENKTFLENRMNNHQLFIELYFAYTYAVHMQSTSSTSREHLKNIIASTKNSGNKKLKYICVKAMWEMIISEYEYINYDISLEYIRDLAILLNKSFVSKSKNETLLNHLKYHDAMTVKSQIETDLMGVNSLKRCDKRTLMSEKYNFKTRHYNTKLRLALARSVIDIEESITVIDECTEYFFKTEGNQSKMYVIGKFSSLFYRMVYRDEPLIDDVIYFHQEMKANQYHNFRKRNYALASYYYMIGDIESGSKYLFPEMYFSRELANRNFAFYQETIALFEFLNGNFDNAIMALKKAYDCFSNLKSYNKIIKHNMDYIKNHKSVIDNIEFWDGKSLIKEKYYIDPRIIC